MEGSYYVCEQASSYLRWGSTLHRAAGDERKNCDHGQGRGVFSLGIGGSRTSRLHVLVYGYGRSTEQIGYLWRSRGGYNLHATYAHPSNRFNVYHARKPFCARSRQLGKGGGNVSDKKEYPYRHSNLRSLQLSRIEDGYFVGRLQNYGAQSK